VTRVDWFWKRIRARDARMRRKGYRRALEHRARYMPQSVELSLEADRDWIEGRER